MTAEAAAPPATDPVGWARWVVYQRERFPLAQHGPLVLAFSLSAICFSRLLRGDTSFPPWQTVVVASIGALCFFLQLRLADEFKDFAEDSRYRPYRAVPRGLVSLRELALVWVLSGIVQIGLSWWLDPRLLLWLAITWGYLALMSKEFFAEEWLRARPFTYMWTHMLIMPLIDIYTAACDWLPAGAGLPEGLKWFLIASFFNGMVIEVGRKIRAPLDEEEGVRTYTVIWGRGGAIAAWLIAMALTLLSALMGAVRIDFAAPLGVLLGGLLLLASVVALRFLNNPVSRTARPFELLSGLWTLALYLGLGVWPLLAKGGGT